MAKNPLAGLSAKKQRYVQELAKPGATKISAAIKAGYSPSTARVASTHIETPDVKRAFEQVMRRKVSPNKIARTIKAGLEATETKFFTSEGIVTDSRDTINYSERRQYAELAARMADYWNPKQEVEVKQSMSEDTAKRLAELGERLLSGISDTLRESLSASHVPLTIDAEIVEAQ